MIDLVVRGICCLLGLGFPDSARTSAFEASLGVISSTQGLSTFMPTERFGVCSSADWMDRNLNRRWRLPFRFGKAR